MKNLNAYYVNGTAPETWKSYLRSTHFGKDFLHAHAINNDNINSNNNNADDNYTNNNINNGGVWILRNHEHGNRLKCHAGVWTMVQYTVRHSKAQFIRHCRHKWLTLAVCGFYAITKLETV